MLRLALELDFCNFFLRLYFCWVELDWTCAVDEQQQKIPASAEQKSARHSNHKFAWIQKCNILSRFFFLLLYVLPFCPSPTRFLLSNLHFSHNKTFLFGFFGLCLLLSAYIATNGMTVTGITKGLAGSHLPFGWIEVKSKVKQEEGLSL